MNLRTQACEAVAALLKERLDVATTVEVLQAPPSKAASYPACALLIDRTEYVINDDYIPVDEDNAPLVGPDAELNPPDGSSFARFDSNTLIYLAGRYMMHGRIFVATRHPTQRAELEDQVFALFLEDDLAPGRIVCCIQEPKVLGRSLPWAWPIAAFLSETEGSTWTSEFAFGERLWSWIKFDIDVDIFVPRSAPQLTTIVLEMDADFTQPQSELTDNVVDLDAGADNEAFLVDQNGISAYIP